MPELRLGAVPGRLGTVFSQTPRGKKGRGGSSGHPPVVKMRLRGSQASKTAIWQHSRKRGGHRIPLRGGESRLSPGLPNKSAGATKG